MRLRELFVAEARSQPKLNRKTSINDILIDASNQTTDTIADGIKNLFVSLTEVDKLGLNPNSMEKYNTPIGVYSYPIEYIIDIVGRDKSLTELPFAGTAPFVNIFKASGNIVNVTTINEHQVSVYAKRMAKVIGDTLGVSVRRGLELIQQFNEESETSAKVKSVGGKFWYVSMKVAELLTGTVSRHMQVAWNKLFRAIGIDGAVDVGSGIIHDNEPYQMVLFSTNAYHDNKRFLNKYSPDDGERYKRIEAGKQTHRDVKQVGSKLRTMTDQDAIARYIIDEYPKYIRLVTDQRVRSYILSQMPALIEYLPKRTSVDIDVALKNDINVISKVIDLDQPTALKYIKKYGSKLDPKYVFALLFKYEVMDEELQNMLISISPEALQFSPNQYASSIAIALKAIHPTPQWLKWMAERYGLNYLDFVDRSEIESEIKELRDMIKIYQRNYDTSVDKVKQAQAEIATLTDSKDRLRKKELRKLIDQGIATFTRLWEAMDEIKRKIAELEKLIKY